MKRCLACARIFEAAEWTCPSCAFVPETHGGFLSFAPALALANKSMPAEAHHFLDSVQEKSFWFRARNRIICDAIRRFAPNATNVIEIGCGTGYVLNAVAETVPSARLTGTELLTNGLPYAKRRLPGAAFYQMDALAIPFEGEFDLLLACDAVEHIEDDRAALAGFYCAAAPGATLLLTVPQHMWLWSDTDAFACHKRRYRRGELEEKTQAAGWRIIRSTSFVTLLLPLMLAQRVMSRFAKKTADPAAEHNLPSWLNRTLEFCMDIDRWLIGAGVSLPAGGTRMVIARKPG